MTPAANSIAGDRSQVFRDITAAIRDANLDAMCHDITVREVLSIWAKGEQVNEVNASIVKMERLGRA